MLRYYVIATLLVVAVVTIAAALERHGPPMDVASVQSHGTPSAPRAEAASTFTPSAFRGTAPWALSALPGCFTQASAYSGPLADVRAHLPRGARPVVRDVDVPVGDCRLSVYADAAEVDRGDDKLFVPPDAHFYVVGDRLALLRSDGERAELRVYHLVGGVTTALRDASGTPGAPRCFSPRKTC